MRTPFTVLAFFIAALALALPASAQGHGHGPDKGGGPPGKGQGQGQGQGQARGQGQGQLPANVAIADRDRNTVYNYYRNDYAAGNCPPGLAKKDNGCLPPGQAKKAWAIGQPLPPDIIYYPLPGALLGQLTPYRHAAVEHGLAEIRKAQSRAQQPAAAPQRRRGDAGIERGAGERRKLARLPHNRA